MKDNVDEYKLGNYVVKVNRTTGERSIVYTGDPSQGNPLPTADVVEVKHGHWIENEDDFWVMCSECGTEFLDDQIGIVDTYKYCPFCGTKMDRERKE